MIEYAWYDFVGNLGVACILVTYAGLQTRKMSLNDLSYSVFNAVGAALIMVSLFFAFKLSSFIIECVWLVVSIYGMVRHQRQ